MDEISNVFGVNGKFAEEKKGETVKKAVGVALSIAVLFATVWVVGKAWRTSQKG